MWEDSEERKGFNFIGFALVMAMVMCATVVVGAFSIWSTYRTAELARIDALQKACFANVKEMSDNPACQQYWREDHEWQDKVSVYRLWQERCGPLAEKSAEIRLICKSRGYN